MGMNSMYRRCSAGHFYSNGMQHGAVCADCGVSVAAWQTLAGCSRHSLSKLNALRVVLRERFDDVHYAKPGERGDLIAIVRAALLDLRLGHPAQLPATPPIDFVPTHSLVTQMTEEIARRIDVATRHIMMIEAASARGDIWAVEECRSGRMSIEELRLRVVITGRVPPGCVYA